MYRDLAGVFGMFFLPYISHFFAVLLYCIVFKTVVPVKVQIYKNAYLYFYTAVLVLHDIDL